ncbi:hypothetical protein HMF8227_01586 [Saliniradius amylolyticus]|uniref:Lipoprotein n=1 Tax=Saliniradius amylolyticus TaxID=2183582 RepID=A0A2S2E487_9ALTE|nr:DUF6279 family lipoprotein [Saliniradius amylolyticus]AWL12060.1 hypothetical protein HMF8227_01586 [Saliniradius amylolyticus]
MTFKRLFVAAAMVLTLAGCSTTFVYNNLDWLVHWYLDDYVDLDRQQKREFDQKMSQWLDWHQQQELPQYRAQLKQLREQLNQGAMTEPQWLEHFEQARGHWERLRDTLVPDLVPLARTLSDKQIASIFKELEGNDRERREERAEQLEGLNQQEIFEVRYQEVVEDLERWVGELHDAQIEPVKVYQSRYRSTFEPWMAYRQRWRDAVKKLLIEHRSEPDFKRRFVEVMTRVEQFQGDELPRLREVNRQHYAHLLAQLLPGLDDKQRSHLNRELSELIGDINSMHEE